jgi:hypothetical protein
MVRVYHAAIWSNGAWTIRHEQKALESLFVKPQQQMEDEDDE